MSLLARLRRKDTLPVDMPNQVFEPYSWENPMPVLPTTMLPLKEQKRTGHLFKGCPLPLPEPDTKASNAPEQCDLCARIYRACREEGEKWAALQEADARIWKVNGIALRADANVEPHPGKAPTPEHVAALRRDDYTGPTSTTPSLPAPHPLPATPAAPVSDEPTASEKQVALLVRLSTEKRPAWVNEVGLDTVEARARKLSRKQASAAIDKLMAEKSVGTERQGKRKSVPAGYYALPTVVEGANDIAFYRVDVPESGKWAGYTFVKRIIGGQSDENVPRHQSAGILARIQSDTYVEAEREVTDDEGQSGTLPARNLTGPEAAAMRYADNAVRCMRCNTRLTRLSSRQAGIGPVCETKM